MDQTLNTYVSGNIEWLDPSDIITNGIKDGVEYMPEKGVIRSTNRAKGICFEIKIPEDYRKRLDMLSYIRSRT